MSKIGIKILPNSQISQCIKIIRKYCNDSIGEIKDAIANNQYVVEGNYINEDDIQLIIKLYNELDKNNIKSEVYEHDRRTNVEFLNNLVKTYYSINAEISDRIEQEIE